MQLLLLKSRSLDSKLGKKGILAFNLVRTLWDNAHRASWKWLVENREAAQCSPAVTELMITLLGYC